MKIKKLNLMTWLMAATCVVGLFSACEKNEDEGENGNPNLSKYLSVSITGCERVGECIVVELDVTNKSGDAISNIELYPSSLKDNLGKEYSTYDNIGIRVAGATKRPSMLDVSFQKGETKKMEVIAAGFDASNTAKSISLSVQGTIQGVTLDKNTVEASASVVDNRVLDNGIQTNDRGLAWSAKTCERKDGDLYVSYNVKNNTGVALKNIEFQEAAFPTKGATFVARDDLGQEYGHLTHAIEGAEKFSPWLTFDLAAGETKTIVTCVPNFDKSGNAKKISICNQLSSENYLFSDPIIRLINIDL